MGTFIKRIVIFSLLLLLLQIAIDFLLPYGYGNEDYLYKQAEYKEKEKDFNTVVFGSSRMYRHLNVSLLDSLIPELQITTYNFATPGSYNPESYYLYSQFLNHLDSGKVKLAYLELMPLNYISTENILSVKSNYWNTNAFFYYSLSYISNASFVYTEQ